MIRTILKYPHPGLSERAVLVGSDRPFPYEYAAELVPELVYDMFQTMRAHHGLGLAAPQVGVLARVIVVDVHDFPIAMVNPTILESDGKQNDTTEGCLSIPGVREEVERAARIKVAFADPTGNRMTIDADGLLARVIQHEVDHLDGITMLDRVDPARRRKAKREAERKAR